MTTELDAFSAMPWNPLSWLVFPDNRAPTELVTRMPTEADWLTTLPVTTTSEVVQESTKMPLTPSLVAVTPETVTAEDDSTRTPLLFCPRNSKPWTWVPVLLATLKPKFC